MQKEGKGIKEEEENRRVLEWQGTLEGGQWGQRLQQSCTRHSGVGGTSLLHSLQ